MKTNGFRFTICVCLLLAAGWYVTSTNAANKNITFDIPTTVEIEGHKSDTVRIVDAYERLMDRYMLMVERNMDVMDGNVKQVGIKTDAIETKLEEISNRLSRIEKALGITETAAPKKKSIEELLKTK